MGEYDRRIAVLRNLRGGALDLGDQRLDIPRADERGEFRTESQLLAPEELKEKTVMYLKMHWFTVCVSVWTAVWVNLW